jgi:DNA-directed RNA polymerase subunit E'
MVHVSQIMDDFVSYDNKNSVFMGRDTKRVLKESDLIRARIISISMASGQYKIGLTTRQPGLGVMAWFERESQKGKADKKERPAKEQKPEKEEAKAKGKK